MIADGHVCGIGDKTAYRWCIVCALTAQAALLGWSGFRHSPTNTEVLCLPAGISHWVLGTDALYRTTPPLVHSIGALPVLLAEPVLDWSRYRPGPGSHAEMAVGSDFLAANGSRVLWMVVLARWACIPLVLLGGYICARWARELYGNWAGLIAVSMWAFSPNILGFGALATSHVAAGSLAVAALYTFCWWRRSATLSRALFAGAVLGLAELSTYALLLLYPILLLLWFGSWWAAKEPTTGMRTFREVAHLGFLVVASIAVVNFGYGFSGSLCCLGDFEFASSALHRGTKDSHASAANNCFRNGPWANVPVPLPKDYVLGLDTLIHDSEILPSNCYVRGEWRHDSPWYYQLYALAVTIPLGTWFLAGIALWCSLICSKRVNFAWEGIALIVTPVVLLCFVSVQTAFAGQVRNVMVIVPFLLIWISKVAKTFAVGWGFSFVVGSLLAWSIASSLHVYPHSISYFNEFAGGPLGGHRHLLGSSLTASQDLLFLKAWLDNNPDARPLKLAIHSYARPQLLDIQYTVPATSNSGFPLEELGGGPCWYAIDIGSVCGDQHSLSYHAGSQVVSPLLDDGDYRYFQRLTPVCTVGYSINIYHVTPEQTARLRQEMGLVKSTAN
jgi:hypothetical protein